MRKFYFEKDLENLLNENIKNKKIETFVIKKDKILYDESLEVKLYLSSLEKNIFTKIDLKDMKELLDKDFYWFKKEKDLDFFYKFKKEFIRNENYSFKFFDRFNNNYLCNITLKNFYKLENIKISLDNFFLGFSYSKSINLPFYKRNDFETWYKDKKDYLKYLLNLSKDENFIEKYKTELLRLQNVNYAKKEFDKYLKNSYDNVKTELKKTDKSNLFFIMDKFKLKRYYLVYDRPYFLIKVNLIKINSKKDDTKNLLNSLF